MKNHSTRRSWLAAALLSATMAGLATPALAADKPRVKFVTTDGEFVIELYPDAAPKTVTGISAGQWARK